ncbi:hypothetical protein D3C79_857670 [compost metagenome]
MLQRRLELQPGGRDDQAKQGIGECHALYVNHRQRQNAPAAVRLFAAQNDARNQRVHRQHAGSEGNADTDQQGPKRRKRQAGWRGLRWRVNGRCDGAHRIQRDHPRFRRVAETGLRAALIGYAQAGAGGRLLQWNFQRELLLENSDVTEEFILVVQSFGQRKGA